MSVAAIFEAVDADDLERVREIARAQPEALRARDTEGATPLLRAQYTGRSEIVEELRRRQQELDVWEAAAVGAGGRVRELVDFDPSLVDPFAPDGFHPLALAAFFGNDEIVRLLLDRGADVSVVARNERIQVTALHAAAAGNHTEIARLLLAAGAPVDAEQPGGFTALHSAAQNGNAELVRLLLEHGADPEQRTADGRAARDLAGDIPAVLAALG